MFKKCGKIQLIIGPMFSGKSTELFRRIEKYEISKKKTILIKYTKDIRYSKKDICTHSNKKKKALSCLHLDEIEKKNINEVDVIGIDEGQFFDDLVEFSNFYADIGKTIIISALDGTFEKKPFPVIANLIPTVETILKLSAICMICGGKACYSKRITREMEINLIGGIDKYIAVCRECFKKNLKF